MARRRWLSRRAHGAADWYGLKMIDLVMKELWRVETLEDAWKKTLMVSDLGWVVSDYPW